MPLVKSGKIIGDTFVHVADDDPLPDGGAILISAARFLGRPGRRCRVAPARPA